MSRKIPTALGWLDADRMGLTSMHEHVVSFNNMSSNYNDSVQFAVSELKKAKSVGLETLVDVSPWRDAEAIKMISEKTEVNIILCTGFYPILTDEQKTFSIDQFRKHMMDEVEKGIADTGIKPGVIKIGSLLVPNNDYETRALTAAGMVQKETGLPICVHSVCGCKEQQRIFEEAGADLSKLYFCHVEAEFGWEGRSIHEQTNYLESIVAKGSSLSYNNFGNWAHTKEENLAKIIQEMINRGYSENQVATMDCIWSYDETQRKIWWEDINENGIERTYSYLFSEALPWMRRNNISEKNILKMVRENPRKIFM